MELRWGRNGVKMGSQWHWAARQKRVNYEIGRKIKMQKQDFKIS